MVKLVEQALLDETQNLSFDKLYVNPQEFDRVRQYLSSESLAGRELHIADFGGGNGSFCDVLLQTLPNAHLYNIDLSAELLKLNKPSPRKTLINKSFFEFNPPQELDIICMNYFLHHLVSDSLTKTRSLIQSALHHAHRCLRHGGSIIVFENILKGRFSDTLSSSLLFRATSSKLLSRITGPMGANTAGVGVYYMGEAELIEFAKVNGFTLSDSFCLRTPTRTRTLLPVLAREIHRVCYFFEKTDSSSASATS